MIQSLVAKYNPSTLSGALDIIIIEHPNGILRSSPWHVRFGKLGLIHHTGKVITITVNGQNAPFLMKVDDRGRGQFLTSQIESPQGNQAFSYDQPISDTPSVSYPTSSPISVNKVSMSPKDVRQILSKKKKEVSQTDSHIISEKDKLISLLSDDENKDFPDVDNLRENIIIDDSTVDLESAIKYEDKDPLPISTVSSDLDLAQSTNTIKKTTSIDAFQEYKDIEENSILTDLKGEKVLPVPSHLLLATIKQFLNYGKNEVAFTVSSLIQGPKTIKANLFLWKSNLKLIVSDVDGTVTTSDLLGHVLPTLGKDWTHPGLAALYNKICQLRSDVKFIYLSSRPIGEAPLTRKMLEQIKQNGLLMPEGPLITCPDLALPALAREMKRKPQEFKIPTLQQIKNLFAPIKRSSIEIQTDDNNVMPFVFGFGNKMTDVISYRGVGLNDNQIRLFDPKHRVMDAKLNVKYDSITEYTATLTQADFY